MNRDWADADSCYTYSLKMGGFCETNKLFRCLSRGATMEIIAKVQHKSMGSNKTFSKKRHTQY